jgi:hypothetical protein
MIIPWNKSSIFNNEIHVLIISPQITVLHTVLSLTADALKQGVLAIAFGKHLLLVCLLFSRCYSLGCIQFFRKLFNSKTT